MNIARIDPAGTVVNIECADAEWVAANQGVDGFTFAESTPDNAAWIGAIFDPVTLLFSPMPIPKPLSPDDVTVSVLEVEAGE